MNVVIAVIVIIYEKCGCLFVCLFVVYYLVALGVGSRDSFDTATVCVATQVG